MDTVTPGLYRHFKGAYYKVIGVAQHSETEEVLVSYKALYGAKGLWVRPLEMFCESVIQDDVMFPRFARCAEQTIVLEVAKLNVTHGREQEFEQAFSKASHIIAAQTGYITHSLHRPESIDSEYLLTVEWQSIDDHRQGFRQSQAYQEWSKLLHGFYDPFPTVEYYKL